MALTPSSVLATAIKDGIETNLYGGDLGPISANIQTLATVIADTIIAHFIANGIITTTVAFPIAVEVVPATGIGATIATGSGAGGIT